MTDSEDLIVEPSLAPAGLLAWALLCAIQDAQYRRISNGLTLGLFVAAVAFLLFSGSSLLDAAPAAVIIALLLALLFSLPGYITGRMGAGDVKLLAALAVASSPAHVLGSIAVAALGMLGWVLGGPALWPRLPERLRQRLHLLAPANRNALPYAPFLFCGLLASILWLH